VTVDEAIEEAAEEAADEAVEEAAEEAADEVADEIDQPAAVVVVEADAQPPVETLNDSLDAAETIRAIAREEAATAAAEAVESARGYTDLVIEEHSITMPHNTVVMAAPPTADDDEAPPADHWYFKNRKRRA
jgi:hypothetical protein